MCYLFEKTCLLQNVKKFHVILFYDFQNILFLDELLEVLFSVWGLEFYSVLIWFSLDIPYQCSCFFVLLKRVSMNQRVWVNSIPECVEAWMVLSVVKSGLINVVNNKFIDKLVSIENQHCSCQILKGNDTHLKISVWISNF